MKEYIEREAVLGLLEKTSPVDFGSMFSYEAHGAVSECLRKLCCDAEGLPAADVAPVRHGRWKNGGNGLYDTCSACGKEIYLAIPMNYCPECGALMDGKEDEHGQAENL